MKTISHLRRTSPGCPAQWSGETDCGEEIYIRYRWGELRFDVNGETKIELVFDFNGWDGCMEYGEMVRHLSSRVPYTFPEKEVLG